MAGNSQPAASFSLCGCFAFSRGSAACSPRKASRRASRPSSRGSRPGSAPRRPGAPPAVRLLPRQPGRAAAAAACRRRDRQKASKWWHSELPAGGSPLDSPAAGSAPCCLTLCAPVAKPVSDFLLFRQLEPAVSRPAQSSNPAKSWRSRRSTRRAARETASALRFSSQATAVQAVAKDHVGCLAGCLGVRGRAWAAITSRSDHDT